MSAVVPPGLEMLDCVWKTCSEGGLECNWLPDRPSRLFTNSFVWDPTQRKILLGTKKRGFGVGKVNGFGGKVDAGETVLAAAQRELREEAGIDANLEESGVLLFYNAETEFAYLIHIFWSNQWVGEPVESDEMLPQWFALPCDPLQKEFPPIPFSKMWADDQFWFPMLLQKIRFAGRVDFAGLKPDGSDGEMLKYWFGKEIRADDNAD